MTIHNTFLVQHLNDIIICDFIAILYTNEKIPTFNIINALNRNISFQNPKQINNL